MGLTQVFVYLQLLDLLTTLLGLRLGAGEAKAIQMGGLQIKGPFGVRMLPAQTASGFDCLEGAVHGRAAQKLQHVVGPAFRDRAGIGDDGPPRIQRRG